MESRLLDSRLNSASLRASLVSEDAMSRYAATSHCINGLTRSLCATCCPPVMQYDVECKRSISCFRRILKTASKGQKPYLSALLFKGCAREVPQEATQVLARSSAVEKQCRVVSQPSTGTEPRENPSIERGRNIGWSCFKICA